MTSHTKPIVQRLLSPSLAFGLLFLRIPKLRADAFTVTGEQSNDRGASRLAFWIRRCASASLTNSLSTSYFAESRKDHLFILNFGPFRRFVRSMLHRSPQGFWQSASSPGLVDVQTLHGSMHARALRGRPQEYTIEGCGVECEVIGFMQAKLLLFAGLLWTTLPWLQRPGAFHQ